LYLLKFVGGIKTQIWGPAPRGLRAIDGDFIRHYAQTIDFCEFKVKVQGQNRHTDHHNTSAGVLDRPTFNISTVCARHWISENTLATDRNDYSLGISYSAVIRG